MPRPEICGHCGEEVRYGYRDGWGWFHREAVDHNPLFGKTTDPEVWRKIMENIHARIAERGTKKVDVSKGESDPDLEAEPLVEEEEIVLEPMAPWVQFDEDFECPRNARLFERYAAAGGWEHLLTYSYGRWLGKVNSHMVRLEVAKGDLKAIAWWRDGKYYRCWSNWQNEPLTSNDLRAKLKENA